MQLFKISLGGSSRKRKEKEERARPSPLASLPESPTEASTFTWSSTTTSEREPAHPSLLSTFSNISLSDTPASHATTAPFSSHSESKLSALVVGAGFAGLSAAISLARQGWKVQVLERSGGPSNHGDCLTIGANAAKIIRRWGGGEVFDEMWKISAQGGWWLMKDEKGETVRTENLKDFPELYGAPVLQGHRGQFLGLLGLEARLNLVDIRLSAEVVRFIDSHKSPGLVVFDGQQEETLFADVIVVADGFNSKSRDSILGSSRPTTLRTQPSLSTLDTTFSPPPPKSNYSVHRGLTRSDAIRNNAKTAYLLDGCSRTWLGEDCHLTMTPLDKGRQISFNFVHSDFKGGPATLDWRQRRPISEVLELMEGWDEALLEAIETFGTCLHWAKTEEDTEEKWISAGGKIILIGDAVHPLPPSSFQGGSQAIEDGASLAICLALSGSQEGVPRALRAFERMRRPRVAEALEAGKQQRALWHTWRSTGRLASHLDLLIAKAYRFDAELETVAMFERTVQRGDEPSWAMAEGRKSEVLAKLQVDKQPPLGELFEQGKPRPKR